MTYTICQRCHEYTVCSLHPHPSGAEEWVCGRCAMAMYSRALWIAVFFGILLLIAVLGDLGAA